MRKLAALILLALCFAFSSCAAITNITVYNGMYGLEYGIDRAWIVDELYGNMTFSAGDSDEEYEIIADISEESAGLERVYMIGVSNCKDSALDIHAQLKAYVLRGHGYESVSDYINAECFIESEPMTYEDGSTYSFTERKPAVLSDRDCEMLKYEYHIGGDVNDSYTEEEYYVWLGGDILYVYVNYWVDTDEGYNQSRKLLDALKIN